jgi:hypothetical protein
MLAREALYCLSHTTSPLNTIIIPPMTNNPTQKSSAHNAFFINSGSTLGSFYFLTAIILDFFLTGAGKILDIENPDK